MGLTLHKGRSVELYGGAAPGALLIEMGGLVAAPGRDAPFEGAALVVGDGDDPPVGWHPMSPMYAGTPGGAVGLPVGLRFHVGLDALSAATAEMYFVGWFDEASRRGCSFGDVRRAFIRVLDAITDDEMVRYDLCEDFSTQIALVFAQVYRRAGHWRFRALGQGYTSGLVGIARAHGLDGLPNAVDQAVWQAPLRLVNAIDRLLSPGALVTGASHRRHQGLQRCGRQQGHHAWVLGGALPRPACVTRP
ncbi:TerD family protein [Actinomadura rugatobispora]|uniref:TerD family protein n=1 Tax=Actinomadura rugatobispora TaxID=1994 RepID=A0ABW1AIL4_9ACTN|nr:hypothetical protein GCM10010200_082160 [Actinomadura rugatobispora]